jgi:8-amino-7-oxononanoate synthase
VIDLAGNDYLGPGPRPAGGRGGVDALRTWGAGSTGSRLVTGSTALHAELEDALAAFTGAPAALVFSSGYAANLGVLTALSGPGRADRVRRGQPRLARGRLPALPRPRRGHPARRRRGRRRRAGRPRRAAALVVTDGVNSVDGGHAPLAALHAVCRARGALLVVDDAHGLGVAGPGGRGTPAAAGLAGADDVVVTVTLSKALGSQGGAALGPVAVVEHLVDTARSFIFDTGLAPACAGAALAALRVLAAEPERPAAVLRAASALAAAAGVPDPASAVVPVVLGEPEPALAAAAACRERGVRVGCFRPPSVPAGTSRLRLTARADLGGADLDRAAAALAEVLAELRAPAGAGR